MATEGSPAVTRSGTISFLGRMTVRGPGQKALASFSSSGGGVASLLTWARSWRWTMRGSMSGRPLTSNIFLTTDTSRAFPARP